MNELEIKRLVDYIKTEDGEEYIHSYKDALIFVDDLVDKTDSRLVYTDYIPIWRVIDNG